MPYLNADDLSGDDFIALVREGTWPEEALMMGFTPADFKFERFSFDEKFLERTDQGRIFFPDGELRWRRTGEQNRVVYLGNVPMFSSLADYSAEMEGLEAETEQLLLWGIRTDTENEWVEQHVPHRFAYPISTSEFSRGRVALTVEKWIDRSGLPRFSRYCSIEEIDPAEKEVNDATG